jgi:DNA polymerase-3 subunit epsilon
MTLLAGARVVVLDTETTGLDPSAGHAIVEVARVTLEDGRVTSHWSSLVNPGRPIPRDAAAVHGITDAMVADAPAPAAVAAELREACADSPLVFHNAPFDLPFLARLMHEGGAPPLLNPVIDTLGLARLVVATRSYSLGALAETLRLPAETKHRALGDALTTARLFLELAGRWERERGAASLAELAAASQDAQRLATADRRRPE